MCARQNARYVGNIKRHDLGWAIIHWFELGTLALLCLNLWFVSSVLNALRETNHWLAFLTRVRWDEIHGPENPSEGRPNFPKLHLIDRRARRIEPGLALLTGVRPSPSGERRRVMSPNPPPLLPPRGHVSGSDQAVSAPPSDPLAPCPRHSTETTARPFRPQPRQTGRVGGLR